MLFSSVVFLYFMLLFFPLYFLTKGKSRLWVCLIGSYIFYGWWDYRFIALILTLTLINYLCGLKLSSSNSGKEKSTYLWISITSSLGILGFFKYFNFFSENLILLLGAFGASADYTTLNIILPVGISFYTFQTMSYTIDIYKGRTPHEESLLRFATFVAFFPQLVAGPIVRASTFIPQLKYDRVFKTEDIINGLHLVIWGYFLKVAIADSLSVVVDGRFDNPASHNALSMLTGIIFYAFQIYGDFAGYSLIAIGIAKMLGFQFPQNFNRPYFSRNLSEFWQRWHISLSSWLRDYLYIPLGGNRRGRARTSINLMATMLLGGLWHGASWNFIIWGGLHGTYLAIQGKLYKAADALPILEQMRSNRFYMYATDTIKVFFCFSLVCIAWVFFRAETLSDSLAIIGKLFYLDDYQFSGVTQKFHVIKGVILIAFLLICEGISFMIDIDQIKKNSPYLSLLFSAFIIVLISLFGTFDSNAFIYFQF